MLINSDTFLRDSAPALFLWDFFVYESEGVPSW